MISANTLFHFTKSLDNIKNILTNTFIPRYCLEHIDFYKGDELDIAFPMVCFCDIPLSQIIDHIDTYGEYSIGLTKNWAMKNGISPLMYYYKNSETNIIANRLFKTAFRLDSVKMLLRKDLTQLATSDSYNLLFYCKTYNGKMWRDGKLTENKVFYNEREWRFVPSIKDLELINPKLFLGKEEFDDEIKRKDCNRLLQQFKISFTPQDIRYIIIKLESERIKMIEMIEYIKGDLFSPNDLKELNSKIISVEQIKEDF